MLLIPNPQIEQGDKQDCVIEDGVFHDNLSNNSMALALADIKNMPSQLTYVDINFRGHSPTISIYHMLLIQLYCHIISMGVNNVVFPNLSIVYDVCTNNISVEGTICCIKTGPFQYRQFFGYTEKPA
jgi:hypothetical protein